MSGMEHFNFENIPEGYDSPKGMAGFDQKTENDLAMGDARVSEQELLELRSSSRMMGNSEETSGETLSPRATKPRGNTHNNIFGEPPPSPRRSRVYHMSSDIFNVGSIVDRSGQHVSSRHGNEQAASSTFADKIGADMGYSGMSPSGTTQHIFEPERKPNARENGCNPVTGDGYAEGDPSKSERRHYPQRLSPSFW